LVGDLFENFWKWYWVGKAQIGPLGQPILDQIIPLWNWLMSFDIARGAVLVVVPLWVLGSLLDTLMTMNDERSGAAGPAADDQTISAADTAEPSPAELTGEQLKAELDRLGKTQTELAEALGVTRGYVSKLIKGAKPFTSELQEQCRAILSHWDVDRAKAKQDV